MPVKPSPTKAPRKTVTKVATKRAAPELVAPQLPTLPITTGKVKVEIQSGNYQQKLPIELGRASDGSLLVDLRKGFSCLLVLPGDKVVRVSISPEEVAVVDTQAEKRIPTAMPVVDELDKLLESL